MESVLDRPQVTCALDAFEPWIVHISSLKKTTEFLLSIHENARYCTLGFRLSCTAIGRASRRKRSFQLVTFEGKSFLESLQNESRFFFKLQRALCRLVPKKAQVKVERSLARQNKSKSPPRRAVSPVPRGSKRRPKCRLASKVQRWVCAKLERVLALFSQSTACAEKIPHRTLVKTSARRERD